MIRNSELAKVFSSKTDKDEELEKLLANLTPLLFKLYVKEKNLRKDYKKQSRYTQNNYFNKLMDISQDYYLNLSFRDFLKGNSEYTKDKSNLLESYTNDKFTERNLFQSFLVEDSDFCMMLTQVSEFVSPALITRTKNIRLPESRAGWFSSSALYRSKTDENNPILKKVTFLKQHYVSTNQTFQNAIEDYFKSGCSNTDFEEIVKNGPLDEAIRLSRDSTAEPSATDISDYELLEIDVVKRITEDEEKEKYYYDERPSKDKKASPFVIELQLELMKGIVTENNAPKIFCSFEDKRLQNEYFRLKAKLDKSVFYKSRPFVSMDGFAAPTKAEGAKKKVGGYGTSGRRRRHHRRSTRKATLLSDTIGNIRLDKLSNLDAKLL